MQQPLIAFIAAVSLGGSVAAQGLIREHPIVGLTSVAVAGLRDVDGDQIADYATAGGGANGLGEVSVYSGASGILLRTFAGDALTGPIGATLADAGDCDGDGVADLIVGGEHGAAVFSIATGARLHWFSAPTAGQRVAVAGLGDVDGDGQGDLLLGVAAVQLVPAHGPSTGWNAVVLGPSYAEVRSGQTGAVLRTHVEASAASTYGGTVCALGDADGDSVSDYAVSTRFDPIAHGYSAVDIFSGASGALLRSIPFFSTDPGLTNDGALAAVGDIDGDGAADIAIGEPTRQRVLCISIASGATLSASAPVQPSTAWERPFFGAYISALGDVDFDGVSELAIARTSIPCPPGGPPCVFYTPSLDVFSGANGASLLGWPGVGALHMAGVGDVDGDGRAELLLGEDNFDPASAGRASLRSTLNGFQTPENFCVGYDVQATSQYCGITWGGSTSVAAADLQLIAFHAPRSRPSYFLAARRSGVWTAGNLDLCVRPPGLRLGPPLPTDAQGRRTYDVFAGPSSAAFVAGTTWFFQFLYESDFWPGSIFRSEGLAVTFVP